MRGKIKKISIPRRLIGDMMCASTSVPFVSLRRNLDIRELLKARAEAVQPPGWAAIFVKAFALVAKEQPVLRTLYAKWPWTHFYELPRSVAMVAIAGIEDGPDCVPPQRGAADQVPAFPKMLLHPKLVLPLRRLFWLVGLNFGRQLANYFGSFGVTSVAAFGGGELHALSPGPFVLSYGVVEPDRTIDVVIRWDHRITDAALIAKAMTRLEQVLNTEISAELRGQRQQTEPKPVRAVAT